MVPYRVVFTAILAKSGLFGKVRTIETRGECYARAEQIPRLSAVMHDADYIERLKGHIQQTNELCRYYMITSLTLIAITEIK